MDEQGPLSSILTAINNLVRAVNNAAQGYLGVQGAQSRSGLTAATVLKASGGRICTVTVTTAGTTTGTVYDANQTGVTSNPVFIIPSAAGAYVANMPTTSGIVIAPGTGQTVAASFS